MGREARKEEEKEEIKFFLKFYLKRWSVPLLIITLEGCRPKILAAQLRMC